MTKLRIVIFMIMPNTEMNKETVFENITADCQLSLNGLSQILDSSCPMDSSSRMLPTATSFELSFAPSRDSSLADQVKQRNQTVFEGLFPSMASDSEMLSKLHQWLKASEEHVMLFVADPVSALISAGIPSEVGHAIQNTIHDLYWQDSNRLLSKTSTEKEGIAYLKSQHVNASPAYTFRLPQHVLHQFADRFFQENPLNIESAVLWGNRIQMTLFYQSLNLIELNGGVGVQIDFKFYDGVCYKEHGMQGAFTLEGPLEVEVNEQGSIQYIGIDLKRPDVVASLHELSGTAANGLATDILRAFADQVAFIPIYAAGNVIHMPQSKEYSVCSYTKLALVSKSEIQIENVLSIQSHHLYDKLNQDTVIADSNVDGALPEFKMHLGEAMNVEQMMAANILKEFKCDEASSAITVALDTVNVCRVAAHELEAILMISFKTEGCEVSLKLKIHFDYMLSNKSEDAVFSVLCSICEPIEVSFKGDVSSVLLIVSGSLCVSPNNPASIIEQAVMNIIEERIPRISTQVTHALNQYITTSFHRIGLCEDSYAKVSDFSLSDTGTLEVGGFLNFV